MQRGPLKVVICWGGSTVPKSLPNLLFATAQFCQLWGRWSEAKVHASVEQCIIIKFLKKEGCKPSEISSRLKRQYGEKTLSNVSVCKWSSAFKKGRETVENERHEGRPRTSITLVTKRLLPERHPQTSGSLAQSVSQNGGDYVEKWQFQFRRIIQRFGSIYKL
jgi:hypothetical protein